MAFKVLKLNKHFWKVWVCWPTRSHGGSLDSSALSGRRRGRQGGGSHRRADPGPHGRLAVKLDGSPQQRLQRGPGHAHRGSERGRLHPDPGGEPVEHRAHLQLDSGPRAPLRLPLARHGLQLRGVHVRGRQRLRPIVRQLRGRPGLEHGQDVLHSAKRGGEAALPGAGPSTASRSWTQPWRPATQRRRRTQRLRRC